MSASRGASHDHWVCTWLSIGGDQSPLAVDGWVGRSDGTCEGCCAGGTAGLVLLMLWLIASPRAYRGTGASLVARRPWSCGPVRTARLPAARLRARLGRGDDVDLAATVVVGRRGDRLDGRRFQGGGRLRGLHRLRRVLAVVPALLGRIRGELLGQLLPALFPLGGVPVAGPDERHRDRQGRQPQAARC